MTEEPDQPTTDEPDETGDDPGDDAGDDTEGRAEALRKGYALAEADLRNAHMEEFNSYRVKRTAELGHTWEPRKSDEQVAEETVSALIAKFPHLRELFKEQDGEEGAAS